MKFQSLYLKVIYKSPNSTCPPFIPELQEEGEEKKSHLDLQGVSISC